MRIDKETLYRLPWSPSDNAGGWVEVTDVCDMHCPGCYRHQLEGHRPLKDVCDDILACRQKTNCDRMGIAGGEPLLYPHLLDVITFIARNGMKPLLLTNGEHLTPELARDLWEAGLVRFHFHVDSGQHRKGWQGKNEIELNALRQEFADVVWQVGKMQCGYNITVRRATCQYLPDIVAWARQNVHKVHHLSIVAYRAIPLLEEYDFVVGGTTVDASRFQHSTAALEELSLTAVEMLDVIRRAIPDFRPCVYLHGTADSDTFKFLVTLQIGSRDGVWGYLGPKSVELIQSAHHFWTGRYLDFVRETSAGKKAYLLGLFDPNVRRAFARYGGYLLMHPWRLFARTGIQSISLQQPNEFLKGEANLCGGCPNMMMHKGKLIPSCRLDEYRMFGGPLVPIHNKARAIGDRREVAEAKL